ncbi:MAG: hypothetical protein VXZ32_09235 [Verrucomicrobiota bacterium]|nr:hypothetical protein [Verrucomicrobiota bacterium]
MYEYKLFIPFLLFLLVSCSNKFVKTPEQGVEHYESRARHYDKLYEIHRLSPPYSSFGNNQNHSNFKNKHSIMTYQNEAHRYRRLAQKARLELSSDLNETED